MKAQNLYLTVYCFLLIFLITACQGNTADGPVQHVQIDSVVVADVETQPVNAMTGEDAADDPAIWIHPADAAKNIIIGTNKDAGISIYNLEGDELHFFPVGEGNNIDVRYGFQFGNGEKADIAACSERIHNKILVFRINGEDGSLTDIGGDRLLSEIVEVYGFSLYRSHKTGKFYAFMNGKSGIIEQWELSPYGDEEISGQIVRTLHVDTQPEGMVTDDELGFL